MMTKSISSHYVTNIMEEKYITTNNCLRLLEAIIIDIRMVDIRGLPASIPLAFRFALYRNQYCFLCFFTFRVAHTGTNRRPTYMVVMDVTSAKIRHLYMCMSKIILWICGPLLLARGWKMHITQNLHGAVLLWTVRVHRQSNVK